MLKERLEAKRAKLYAFCDTFRGDTPCGECPLKNDPDCSFDLKNESQLDACFKVLYKAGYITEEDVKALSIDLYKPSYWDSITAIKHRQTHKGIMSYGQTLEENKELSIDETLTMLEEELIDGLMYIEHVKRLIREREDDLK